MPDNNDKGPKLMLLLLVLLLLWQWLGPSPSDDSSSGTGLSRAARQAAILVRDRALPESRAAFTRDRP